MRKGVEGSLKLVVSGLVLVSYFALTSTFRYGQTALMVPVLAIAFMPVGEWLDRRYRVYRQITSSLILLYILTFPFIIRSYSLLDSVVSLVMLIQIYSLIHVKRVRNYGHILLMSFFLILAASVLTPRSGIAVVYFFFVVLGAWALTLLEMYGSEMSSEAKSAATVGIQDPRGKDLGSARGHLFDWRLSSILHLTALMIVALTVALFILTPRMEAGLLGASDAPAQFTMGLSTEIDLTLGGILGTNTSPVMRVQFPQEPGGRFDGPLLWRSTTLDQYTGTKWVRRGLVMRGQLTSLLLRRLRSDPRIRSQDGLDRGSFQLGRQIYQEVYLDRVPENGVPVLQMVKTIIPNERNSKLRFRWDKRGDFTVNMSRSVESVVSLRVWSEVIEADPEVLRQTSQNYGEGMTPTDIRNLTEHNLLPRTQAKVQDLTKDAPTPYDEVMALHDWLRYDGGFVYSTEIPFLPQKNPLDEFILKEKSGHCELYASALALMVRSLGIPTRVVRGYRGGTWNANDASYTITNDMAHLWTEVYFPEVGWVSFDASPPAETPPLFSLSSLARSYSRYMLRARIFWMSNVISYAPEKDPVVFRDAVAFMFRPIASSWGSFSLPQREGSFLDWLRVPLVAVIFIVAFYLAARLVLRRTRSPKTWRPELTADQKRAVKLRELMNRKLRRLGADCEGLTAEEMSGEVEKLTLEDSASALDAIDAYSASRFGRRSLPSATLRGLLARVRVLRLVRDVRG